MGLLAFLKTQFVVHLLIGFVFVVSGLVINSIQLCTLVLWPVNKQLYRRLNCRLAYSLWSREYCVHWVWHGGGRVWRQSGQPAFCWTAPNKLVQGPVGVIACDDEPGWPGAPQPGTRGPLLAVRNVWGAQPELFTGLNHAVSRFPSLWTHREGGSMWFHTILWIPENKQSYCQCTMTRPDACRHVAGHRPADPSTGALPSSGLLSHVNTSASLSEGKGPTCLLIKCLGMHRCYLCALVMCVPLCV